MLINKKTVAFVATVLAAASSPALAYRGGIRGLTNSNGGSEVLQEIEEEKRDRRRLKEEKNVPAVPAPSLPVTPPTPQPVGPSPFEQFQTGCGVSFASTCNQCLFGYTFLSQGNGSNCGPVCLGISSEILNEKVSCGRNDNTPPAPVPVSVPSAAPAPVAPAPEEATVPPAPLPGPEVCSPSLPSPGDECATGDLPFVYCCYSVNAWNNIEPPPLSKNALICSCLKDELKYNCNVGSTRASQCGGTIIGPDNAPTPVVPPTAPTPTIPAPDSTVPTDLPIIAMPTPIIGMPTPATFAPAIDPVPVPPPAASGDGSFCLAVNDGKLPEDGSSCAGQLPADSTTGVCGGERLIGKFPSVTAEMVQCTCNYSSGSTWMCEVISVTTPAPAPPSSTPGSQCPPQDQPPLQGSSCVGYLGVAQVSLVCGFAQSLPDQTFERIDCTCNASDQIWMCDGTLTPISSPTLMPAGQSQLVSMVPVQTNPVPGFNNCPATFAEAGDGNSCEGVLPPGLSEATCSWSQTITQDGVTSTESAACTCFSVDSRWKCEGSITPPIL